MRRSDYSGKAITLRQEVERLVEEGDFQGGFLVDKPPEAIVRLNAPDLEGFPTLQRPLQETLELLRSDKLKGIGIFGTVGVGKTAIMKNLNNHEEVAKMFDIVIWVNVSREMNEEKLQLKIAQRLKLKMESATCSGDLARIISEHMKDKKYLLLLDEVMDSIDLQQIGIPDNGNGSKVVLTTEFRHVCSSMTERMVKVDRLSPDEAWRMFQQTAAEKIDLPDVEPVARLVAEECDRLPLVIRTVASSFKLKESDSEWRNGLRELEKWPEIEIQGLTNMHAFLKFCYHELKDEKKKKCFLYGALYPAGSKIYVDHLVECWAAEGFLGTIDDRRRFRDARDEGYDLLGHLVNVSLLEKGERMIYVQVNNSVRQVALYISSQEPDCKFIALKREHSPYPQNATDWQQAKRISMIEGKLLELPESPNCEELLSLLLQRNPNLATIPQSFFQNMQKLIVLDLYRTGIASLPLSVSTLTRLKALFLNDCPSITKLPTQVAELRFLEPPEKIVKLNAPDLEGFPTLRRSLQEIRELLRSDKLKGIGIFGTVGVGKTTIMKNLNNPEEVAKMFDIVIWINVSRERNDEKLQLNIAQRLKLKAERATCSGELATIISEFMKHKKYLLLLDEVMDSIDLQQIGIPNMIAAEKIDLPDVEPVARLVVEECDRLPLVIRTVASSFKLKDSDSEWRNELSELEKWPTIEIPGLTKMSAALKFCYDELKDDKKKKCFLYGALYPADSKIYTDYYWSVGRLKDFLAILMTGGVFGMQEIKDLTYWDI
ncbi:NB-ARC - like 10 [Theobroma cacao]|nr:NB-ARC - like 10 [Theobroma cacao]